MTNFNLERRNDHGAPECQINLRNRNAPRRMIVDVVDRNVSPELARWIEHQLYHGAEIEDVERRLKSALTQIDRAKRYCEHRETEAA